MSEQKEIAQVTEFKDRKVGLVIFGSLEILFGVFCGLIVLFMLASISTLAQSPPVKPLNLQMVIPAMTFYGLLAVFFIWLGIGSMRTRRWARALLLVFSWIWLVSGVLGVVLFFVIMPDLFNQIAQNQKMPGNTIFITQLVIGAVLGFFYILIPGVFVLFYRSKHVKATCEFRDSQVRWTDKCPLPLLALSILLILGAYSLSWMLFYGRAVPLFGTIVSGVPGIVVILAVMLILLALARGIYKTNLKAWWGALALGIIGSISGFITFSRFSLLELYEKMQFPAQDMEFVKQSGVFEKMDLSLIGGVSLAVYLAYLLFVKRYFRVGSAQQTSS